MLNVLATGTLVADPVTRTSSSGTKFVTASLRTPTDDDALIMSVIAFDDAVVAAFLRLRKGASISITGRAKLAKWQGREGERTGLQMVADAILTAYQVKSRRASRKGNGTGASRHAEAGYDDWIQP